MDLWSEPMTGRTMALLLAGIVVWLILIAQEIRDHVHRRAARSGQPREGVPTELPYPGRGLLSPRTMVRAIFLFTLLVFPFLIVGAVFGAAGAALVLALFLAAVMWSLWRAAPAILAQCGARPVIDERIVELVHELAAKAGIPAPHILETRENHPNAFALGTGPARAAIIMTLGLRMRLNVAELRAVLGHEIAHIAHRNTARATLGVTFLSPIATLARRLGLIGPSVHRQGGGALLFSLLLAPVSVLVLRLSAVRERAYEADREGALLCGNADDLISALAKLDASAHRISSITANDQPALAALFIVNPLPRSWVGRLFTAQPPIARRLARLRSLSVATSHPPGAVAQPAS